MNSDALVAKLGLGGALTEGNHLISIDKVYYNQSQRANDTKCCLAVYSYARDGLSKALEIMNEFEEMIMS